MALIRAHTPLPRPISSYNLLNILMLKPTYILQGHVTGSYRGGLVLHVQLIVMHFHCQVRYPALSLCYACIRSSGIILIPQATFVPNLVSFAPPCRKIAYSITHSCSLFDASGTKAFTPELATTNVVVH